MGVNSLPKTVTRQRRGCDVNPGPSAPVSSTLTTRLPSHSKDTIYDNNIGLFTYAEKLGASRLASLMQGTKDRKMRKRTKTKMKSDTLHGSQPRIVCGVRPSFVAAIDVKNVFYVFFSLVTFLLFNVFYFPNVIFLFLKKTLAKFRAASRLTRSAFKITATK